MFLAPDGDEIAIADAAAGFLGEAMPRSRLHKGGSADMSPVLRQRLGEMGWFSLASSEEIGGSGLSAVEHTLFFREVGRLCGPVDLLAQSLSVFVVQDSELRRSLISGAKGIALAVKDGSRVRLLGPTSASFALEVDPAGARLHSIDAFVAEARSSLDPATTMQAGGPAMSAPLAEVEDPAVWQLGQLGAAALLVGIAEAALALIVDYAKVRETFGRKIGAYQAVRHACADMALRVEAARCQLWYAAAAVKERRNDSAVHLDAAKYLANQAAIANADTNIQLHGGIGVTDEHDAHLMLKHAMLIAKLFGTRRALLAQLLDARVSD